MNYYEATHYKEILKENLTEKKKHISKRFTFQNMAHHCGIQKTYLSKVLGRDGNLTADQLFLASDFLGLDADQREYLQSVCA